MWLIVIFSFFALVSSSSESSLNFNVTEGIYSQELSFSFNTTTKQFIVFQPDQFKNPYKVSVWSKDIYKKHPVLVVVEQEKDVLSWTVPYVLINQTNAEFYFTNISRIICSENMFQDSAYFQNFTVSLSTSSPSNVSVSLKVEEYVQFHIDEETTNSVSVSPSQPQYFLYRFRSEEYQTVSVEIHSNDTVCLTVSIQNLHCPVDDLDPDVHYTGVYETLKTKGGFRISKRNYKVDNGFLLVFDAKVDNYRCQFKEDPFLNLYRSLNIKSRISSVTFTVKEINDEGHYILACLALLGIVALFCLISIAIYWIFIRYRQSNNTEQLLPQSNDEDVQEESNVPKPKSVADLCKEEHNYRKSFNYCWHILNVSVFYSIPAVQLVVTHLTILHSIGNTDICYYNFLCANPLGYLDDFNHVYSNIGYITGGVLFLTIVFHRQFFTPKPENTGIPTHYGLFYAMGYSLIIEGVLSALYHICPDQKNFQFDTSFMYVMAVLCITKIYQNRHPDIIPTAYTTFGVLGAIILIDVIGIINYNRTTIFAILVSFSHIGFSIYISLKIYYFDNALDGLRIIWRQFQCNWTFLKETYSNLNDRGRCCTILTANLFNCISLGIGIHLYCTDFIDSATLILTLLMSNAFFYLSVYTSLKFVYKEYISWQAAVYGLLSVIFWLAATVFFVKNETKWTESAAQSRESNNECEWLNFYDNHDLWHLLSAGALYFTFMYLLCIDDNVIYKNRKQLKIF